MQTSGAMDAMGIESRDEFRCGTQHDGICFPRSRRNLHRKLCCSDLSVSVAYFIWKEINFPSVLVETGRKYAFLIYLLHPAVSDLLKKCSEGLGVSNCQIYFWLRRFGIYADSGDSFWHICGLCVCKAKYFAE